MQRGEDSKAIAASFNWFHAIDFGDFQTAGRFPKGQKQNQTLFPVIDLIQGIDLNGMSCLDVGAAHGLTSFGMKMKGAEYVAATDIMSEKSPPFEFAQNQLGLSIDYRTNCPISRILDEFPKNSFDVIVCAGVFYHMLNPFEIFSFLPQLLKTDGLIIVETAYEPHGRDPIMHFNSERQVVPDIYTYWIPTASAVAGMGKLASLSTIAVRMIHSPDRVAFLFQKVLPEEVAHRNDLLRRMHETGIQDPSLVIPSSREKANISSVVYSGPRDTKLIDVQSYEPDFKPHPKQLTNPVGQGVWLSEQFNL